MKAVALIRVSSEDQVKGSGLDTQRKAIIDFCKQRQWQIVKWVVLEGRSSFCHRLSDVQRKLPELWELCTAPQLKFDRLVFYSQSRFGRMPAKCMMALSAFAEEHAIQFVNLEHPDLQGDGADHVNVAQSNAAYTENCTKARNSVNGCRDNCTKGWRYGSFAPTGYRRILYHNGQPMKTESGALWVLKKGERKPNSAEYKVKLHPCPLFAPIIHDIFEWYSLGSGTKIIARQLNQQERFRPNGKPWLHCHVSEILDNPVYAGIAVYGKRRRKTGKGLHDRSTWTINDNAHEALCEPEHWRYACERKKEFKPGANGKVSTRRRTDRFMLNGGLTVCSGCGANMRGLHKGTGCRPYYVCGGATSQCTDCNRHSAVDGEQLEGLVLAKVRELLDNGKLRKAILKVLSVETDQTTELESRLLEVQKQHKNLVALIGRIGGDEHTEQQLIELRGQTRTIERQIEEEKLRQQEPQKLLAGFEQLHGGLLSPDREEQRRVLKKLLPQPLRIDVEQKKLQMVVGIQNITKGGYPVRDSNP